MILFRTLSVRATLQSPVLLSLVWSTFIRHLLWVPTLRCIFELLVIVGLLAIAGLLAIVELLVISVFAALLSIRKLVVLLVSLEIL